MDIGDGWECAESLIKPSSHRYTQQTSEDQALVYVASKKLAEEAAWQFMGTEKPSFTLAT